jgi:hypothetical protein
MTLLENYAQNIETEKNQIREDHLKIQIHTMKYNLIFGGIEQTTLDTSLELLHFWIKVLSPIYYFRRILLVNCITSLFLKFHGNNFPYTFVVFVVRKAGNNIAGFAINARIIGI